VEVFSEITKKWKFVTSSIFWYKFFYNKSKNSIIILLDWWNDQLIYLLVQSKGFSSINISLSLSYGWQVTLTSIILMSLLFIRGNN